VKGLIVGGPLAALAVPTPVVTRGGLGNILVSRRKFGERALLIITLMALCWVMDSLYANTLVPAYGNAVYPGYPLIQHGANFRVFCWLVGALPGLWMPITVRRPSQVLTWCMYLMINIPTAVIGSYAAQSRADITEMLIAVTAGIAIVNGSTRLPVLKIPAVRATSGLFWLFVIALGGIAYVTTVRTFGSTFHFVTLNEVYLQREIASTVAASAFTNYVMKWQATVINPMLMALGVARKRPLLFLAGAGGDLFLFGVAAQRALLATPFIVLGLYFLLRKGKRQFGLRASIGSVVAFVVPTLMLGYGGLADKFAGLVFDSLILRLYVNSGFLTVLYFKFFDAHPHVGFAEVKPFSLFLHSPYDVTYPVAMALGVWGQYNDPNANLFADGFAQLGYAGLVIEALGLAFMFWLLDSIALGRKLSVSLVAMMCGGELSVVVNASTPNIILGEGFALLLVVLTLLPHSETILEDAYQPSNRRGS
jgi:hypothetical protein